MSKLKATSQQGYRSKLAATGSGWLLLMPRKGGENTRAMLPQQSQW